MLPYILEAALVLRRMGFKSGEVDIIERPLAAQAKKDLNMAYKANRQVYMNIYTCCVEDVKRLVSIMLTKNG